MSGQDFIAIATNTEDLYTFDLIPAKVVSRSDTVIGVVMDASVFDENTHLFRTEPREAILALDLEAYVIERVDVLRTNALTVRQSALKLHAQSDVSIAPVVAVKFTVEARTSARTKLASRLMTSWTAIKH